MLSRKKQSLVRTTKNFIPCFSLIFFASRTKTGTRACVYVRSYTHTWNNEYDLKKKKKTKVSRPTCSSLTRNNRAHDDRKCFSVGRFIEGKKFVPPRKRKQRPLRSRTFAKPPGNVAKIYASAVRWNFRNEFESCCVGQVADPETEARWYKEVTVTEIYSETRGGGGGEEGDREELFRFSGPVRRWKISRLNFRAIICRWRNGNAGVLRYQRSRDDETFSGTLKRFRLPRHWDFCDFWGVLLSLKLGRWCFILFLWTLSRFLRFPDDVCDFDIVCLREAVWLFWKRDSKIFTSVVFLLPRNKISLKFL